MNSQHRIARTRPDVTLLNFGELRRALGGAARWWLILFGILIVLREMLQSSWAPVSFSIPIWLVFIPLALVFLIRPVRADDAPLRTVLAPVEGRWVALNSPATKIPSHGVRTLGQAFAIDILHPSNSRSTRLGWALRQRRPEEFSCYGTDVRAVQEGRVVRVHRSRRDHCVRTSWPGIIFMLTVEAILRELGGPNFVLGNHVVIEHAHGSYSAYAHLRHNSIGVQTGAVVVAGQVIGQVGNTGNSSEPHLHFQLMDRARPDRAAGLPFRWSNVTIEPNLDPALDSREEPSPRLDGLPGTAQIFVAMREE